jgi:hypothetical protein
MQHLSNGFNKFNVDDLVHVKMLIAQNIELHVFYYIIISARCNL